MLKQTLCSTVFTRGLLVLMSVVVFGGCASKPDLVSSTGSKEWRTDASIFADQYDQIEAINAFRLDAKIAVTVDDSRESANLIWQYDSRQASKLTLFGAFGAGTTTLEIGDGWARATDSKGRQYEDFNPERLLFELTGWLVPVRELQFWLMGVAYPDSPFRYQLDLQNKVTALEQSGWQIDYQGQIDGLKISLPKRLLLKGRQSNQHIQIKLVAKKWQIR